jgi:GT2 family glycosyltransferase
MKIGIVVPVLNQFQLAVEALSSVRSLYNWEPVVIPNHVDGKPLSEAWNDGIRWAFSNAANYVLVINDDIVFGPYTINKMIQAITFHKDIVLVTGNNIRDEMAGYNTFGSIRCALETSPEKNTNNWTENPDFSCFMIGPETISEVGKFDENFVPAYFEDNDFHFRIKQAGKLAYNIADAEFFHYGSRTQNAGPPIVDSYNFERNRAYYISKWGGIPGEETYTTPFNNPNLTIKDW